MKNYIKRKAILLYDCLNFQIITWILCTLFVLFYTSTHAQTKTGYATRITETVKIDGSLNEKAWKDAFIFNGFKQYDPYHGAPVKFDTEVKILYDDFALYIGALMYDTHTDSLLLQLGNRDSDLNADAFGFKLDTYGKQNDAFVFEVSASGVQKDYRERDLNFNAVWESQVGFDTTGWIAEIRIPWSALRFPDTEKQVWRIQLYRNLRRVREWTQWALEDKDASNKLAQWGELHGIEKVNPPLRLSLSPYFTAHAEHYPFNVEGESNLSENINGGVDLKLGLGEAYTLDVTLLPDFSQVQSDNQIKNLSAFETVYDENRPFFQESVDLFNKGGLFYTRRIGRIPMNYYNLNNDLGSNEYIVHNPYQAKLLNAVKFSGRDKNGLAIGIFNAVTDNTYAIVADSITKTDRKVLTEPLTNYNIIVADKAFKNSSSVYLINTSVIRRNAFDNASVSGGGVNLLNNKNTYSINLSGSHSRIYNTDWTIKNSGNTYYINAGKVKGKFLFNVYQNLIDNTYNKNDLGLLQVNSIVYNGININYNIYKPFSTFLYLKTRLSYKNDFHYLTHKTTNDYLELFANTTLNNYLSIWSAFYAGISPHYDYYEPRTAGRYYILPPYEGCYLNFSSDYRKTLAIDGGFDLSRIRQQESLSRVFYLMPILRFNDHLSANFYAAYNLTSNNRGYVGTDDSLNVYFGKRKLQTFENTLAGLYIIKNDLSLSLRVRHYWIMGEYDKFFLLAEDGNLSDALNYNAPHDFNFNSFNIDMVFNWQFAPGSNLSLIWKNALMDENTVIVNNYYDNLSKTLSNPQLNMLTLKLLYYLDYQTLKSRRNIFQNK